MMKISVRMFASQNSQTSATAALRDVVQLARNADELGYDTVWFAEHHRTPWNVCPDPLTLAAFVAATTTRISVGTAVVNLTLHHPLAVAEHRRGTGRPPFGLRKRERP